MTIYDHAILLLTVLSVPPQTKVPSHVDVAYARRMVDLGYTSECGKCAIAWAEREDRRHVILYKDDFVSRAPRVARVFYLVFLDPNDARTAMERFG